MLQLLLLFYVTTGLEMMLREHLNHAYHNKMEPYIYIYISIVSTTLPSLSEIARTENSKNLTKNM